jgi:hypothetical protein
LGHGDRQGTDNTLGTNDDVAYQEMVLTLGQNAFLGATAVQVFIGVGGVLDDTNTPLNFSDDVINLDSGVGFYASLNLSLITLKNNNKTPTVRTDDKSYLGLELIGASAALVGVDGLTLGIYNAGVRRQPGQGRRHQPGQRSGQAGLEHVLHGQSGLIPTIIPHVGRGRGHRSARLAGAGCLRVVLAKGSFRLQLGTVIDKGTDNTVGTNDDIAYQAMVLTLGEAAAFDGATKVEVFIGVGGVLEDNGANTDTPLVFSDDQINTTSGIGFYASLNLSLITLKNNNKTPTNRADDKSYLGLELIGASAALVGVDGLTLGIYNAGVSVNQAKDGDTSPANDPAKLNWNTFFNGKAGMPVAPGSIPHVARAWTSKRTARWCWMPSAWCWPRAASGCSLGR